MPAQTLRQKEKHIRCLTICAQANMDFKLGLTETAVNVHIMTVPSAPPDVAADDSASSLETWSPVSMSCVYELCVCIH